LRIHNFAIGIYNYRTFQGKRQEKDSVTLKVGPTSVGNVPSHGNSQTIVDFGNGYSMNIIRGYSDDNFRKME
jgi:hypothetical protein